MIPEEVLLNIISYCKYDINLFLTSKQFNRLCNEIFKFYTKFSSVVCEYSNYYKNPKMIKSIIQDSRIDLIRYVTTISRCLYSTKNSEIVKELFENKTLDSHFRNKESNQEMDILMLYACEFGDEEVVRKILTYPLIGGEHNNEHGRSWMHCALRHNNQNIYNLLKNEYNYEYNDNTIQYKILRYYEIL